MEVWYVCELSTLWLKAMSKFSLGGIIKKDEGAGLISGDCIILP